MAGELAVTLTVEQLKELVSSAVARALEEQAPVPPAEVLDRMGAAELLGVSLVTLRKLVLDGDVVERRLGDSPRYLRSELLASLRAPAIEASHPRPKPPRKAGRPEGNGGGSVRALASGPASVRKD